MGPARPPRGPTPPLPSYRFPYHIPAPLCHRSRTTVLSSGVVSSTWNPAGGQVKVIADGPIMRCMPRSCAAPAPHDGTTSMTAARRSVLDTESRLNYIQARRATYGDPLVTIDPMIVIILIALVLLIVLYIPKRWR